MLGPAYILHPVSVWSGASQTSPTFTLSPVFSLRVNVQTFSFNDMITLGTESGLKQTTFTLSLSLVTCFRAPIGVNTNLGHHIEDIEYKTFELENGMLPICCQLATN